jgi:hypothetical protein
MQTRPGLRCPGLFFRHDAGRRAASENWVYTVWGACTCPFGVADLRNRSDLESHVGQGWQAVRVGNGCQPATVLG